MGKTTGFKEFKRKTPAERPVVERIRDCRELYEPFSEEDLVRQSGRCMNCGVPFCHIGCPLGNVIPDWNDLAYRRRWEDALHRLLATNNFPEFTGRLCPAPCEESCVLGLNEPPVTIELIEKSIVEFGFARGLVRADPPVNRTGRSVAVIGSGPAGLACAQQLNRAGHTVTVYERADRIGGLLRYGIPDFKLEKWVIDRRLRLMEAEGVTFAPSSPVGTDAFPVERLKAFDAVALCCGSTRGRDLPIPGRDLAGIHPAMDFLPLQNRIVAGDALAPSISAEGKHVVVIGGGDTGSDCIGTSIRQGAASVVNFELLAMPPADRPKTQPWPYWPMKLRKSTSHAEGCDRFFSVLTKRFEGAEGQVTHLVTANVEFVPDPASGRTVMRELPGTQYEWRADLVLLALGFVGPEVDSVVRGLGVEVDARGNIKAGADYATTRKGVFAAGDARRGQSLVVWAISEGRECARSIDQFLMGSSRLPTKGPEDLPRV
jgi:glutamate synthase (NADPH/NADH) small chain